MKQFLKEILSEAGDYSMTRFLSLVCVLTASIIALTALFTDSDLNAVVGICSTFLGFGLGAKVIQKQLEE